MDFNALTKSPTKSLDDVLLHVEKQWQKIGLTKSGIGKEVFKSWMDEVGWKMAIVSLMELQQTDPKGFLQMFSALGEYVSPKSTRQNGEQSKGLSISFNMPSDKAIELPPTVKTQNILEQQIDPVVIQIVDRSKSN